MALLQNFSGKFSIDVKVDALGDYSNIQLDIRDENGKKGTAKFKLHSDMIKGLITLLQAGIVEEGA